MRSPEKLSAILSAVADPTRRKIILLLAEKDMTSGEVAQNFPSISRPAVAKHMRILRKTGIVMTVPMGRKRLNRLYPLALSLIDDWSREVSGIWDARIAGDTFI